MAYTKFNPVVPDGTTETITQVPASVRVNQTKLVDAKVMGDIYVDVSMVVNGDPEQPDNIVYTGPTGVIRESFTWNADGDPTEIYYEKSSDGGATWTNMGTKSMIYVGGEVSGSTWNKLATLNKNYEETASL